MKKSMIKGHKSKLAIYLLLTTQIGFGHVSAAQTLPQTGMAEAGLIKASYISAPKLSGVHLVSTARARTALSIRYDPKYVRLSYPDGDVSADTGVCSDVIIRSLRTAYDHDLQKSVHEDMTSNFGVYPKIWGLKSADKNIDHRRVPNLEKFFKRRGADLPITKEATDYQAGDIVSWRLGGRVAHIGIVSDKKSAWGTPLIIHNIGGGVVEDDLLFNAPINGHFRFRPKPNRAQ